MKSDAFNSDVIYVTVNYSYGNEVFEKVEQKVFLKEGSQLVEIPERYSVLYNQLQNFVAIKGLAIIQNNKNLNSKEELKTSIEISMISHNDFYGYLVASNVQSLSDLNQMFFHFKGYLSKYNYHNLNKQIDSLNLSLSLKSRLFLLISFHTPINITEHIFNMHIGE